MTNQSAAAAESKAGRIRSLSRTELIVTALRDDIAKVAGSSSDQLYHRNNLRTTSTARLELDDTGNLRTMAYQLHITFKAGLCEAGEKDSSAAGEPRHIKPLSAPGFIYLFTEDDLLHFCWRPRSAPLSEPDLDLIMFAGDAAFMPYKHHGSKYDKTQANGTTNTRPPTNGRLFVLSFSSSSDRHFFWLQSKSQSAENDSSWYSPRDLKIAEIVNKLLAGEEVDTRQEMSTISTNGNGPSGGDDDTTMDDDDGAPPSPSHHRAASGGAGAGATGGDIRDEGEESREGGADGGRA